MEGNYEISSMPFSLKNICAAKVVHHVLRVNGIKSGYRSMTESFEQETKRRIRKLELPLTLIEMLEILLIPMQEQLGDWYGELLCDYMHCKPIQCDAILTPQGTVDKLQSVKAILKMEPMDEFDRYILACEYCCEEQILEMFKELNLMERNSVLTSPCNSVRYMMPLGSKLAKFWSQAFQGQFGPVIHCKYLPINAYNEGIKIAILEENDVAIRHFIEKVSFEEVRNYIYMVNNTPRLHYNNISPATYYLLFSKLSKDQQRDKISVFSRSMLQSFMLKPYLYFIADDTVHSLVRLLDEFEYWLLMKMVAIKMRVHNIGYHYRKFFAILWKVGSCHRNSNFDYADIVREVIMTKSQQLLNIIFSEISINTKDELLMRFDNSICFMLFANNYYEIFRIVIEACCMNRKNVLLTFKSRFVAWIQMEYETYFCENYICPRNEFPFRVKHFAEIVDEIVAKIRDEYALDL